MNRGQAITNVFGETAAGRPGSARFATGVPNDGRGIPWAIIANGAIQTHERIVPEMTTNAMPPTDRTRGRVPQSTTRTR